MPHVKEQVTQITQPANRQTGAHGSQTVSVEPLVALLDDETTLNALDEIFFSSSVRQHFNDEGEMLIFRERWLGRYLRDHGEHAFAAIADGQLVGYVVGCLKNPNEIGGFEDITAYAALPDLVAQTPAHLHINVLAGWRSRGVGAHLIRHFAAHAAAQGCPAVHIITGRGGRNVGFYERNGFHTLFSGDATASPATRGLVFMARPTTLTLTGSLDGGAHSQSV